MPIRPDLRPFYKPPTWPAVRRRILERAGGMFDLDSKYIGGAECELCRAPDREKVIRWPGTQMLGSAIGEITNWASILEWSLNPQDGSRLVRIVLTVAHLNHLAGDDRDENLLALCQWCHLHYDAEHHKESRSARKDRARPLL